MSFTNTKSMLAFYYFLKYMSGAETFKCKRRKMVANYEKETNLSLFKVK